MKFFVTGGNGFIGKAFCELAQSLRHDVFVVDKNGVFPVDIANGTVLNNMMSKCQPDWVVHLAATPGTGNGKDDVGAAAMQDIFNTRNVLQAMQLTGCKRILFASTGSIYNTDQFPTPETATVGPIGFYASGKLACESFIQAWCEAHDGTGIALRLGTVLGPGNAKGFTKDFVRKLKNDPTKIEVMGDGKQIKSYLHVNALTRAMMAAIRYGNVTQIKDFEVFNVGHECEPWSMRECVLAVARALETNELPNFLPNNLSAYGDVHRIELDTKKIGAETGWYPHLSINEAISSNVKWLLEHPEVFG